MAISEQALRQVGIRATPDQVERLLLVALSHMKSVPTGVDPAQELSPSALAALQRGGFTLAPVSGTSDDDPLARTIATYSALLTSGLTVQEASRLLGVNPSRVRQRLIGRTLFGIKETHGWRLPTFQFGASRTLPGIAQVLPRLDPELRPVAVYSWFTEPDPDLQVDDTAVSPRDWLASGHDPEVVAAIAGDL
jgi:hypothetical protein